MLFLLKFPNVYSLDRIQYISPVLCQRAPSPFVFSYTEHPAVIRPRLWLFRNLSSFQGFSLHGTENPEIMGDSDRPPNCSNRERVIHSKNIEWLVQNYCFLGKQHCIFLWRLIFTIFKIIWRLFMYYYW